MSFRRITLNPHGIAAKLGTSKENTKEKGRIFQDFLSLDRSAAFDSYLFG